MPILKNPRHERFAQELAKGKSATEAYEAAGYKGDRRAASNLWTKVDLRERVDELKSRVAERVIEKTAVTRADILGELHKIAAAPIGHEHVKASDKRAACVNYAEIEGWKIERHEHGMPGEFADIDAMTPDERRANFIAELEAAGVLQEEGEGGSGDGSLGEGMPEVRGKIH